MDGTYDKDGMEVICCFCGKSLPYHKAMVINVQSNVNSEEVLQLFCHRNHFKERLDKSISLYIDIDEN